MGTHSSSWSGSEPAVLVQALELHQAELEAQNLELLTTVERMTSVNAALVIARDRFRALYERAPIPYLTIAHDRTIVDVNRASADLLDTPRTHLLGAAVELFIEEAGRSRFRSFVDEVFATGHARSTDLHVVRPDGPPIDCLIDGVVVPADGAEPAHCVLAIVDITARKLVELTRRKAQDEVLAVVSHDLRGPLNAIGLACDALSSGLEPAELRECVAAIERAAARCERLIKDLLGVAHIESGRLTLEPTWFDVGDLARTVCRDYGSAAAAVGAPLTCVVGDGRLTIHGDHARLHQVVSNLINNSLVHARGAAIEVSVTDRGESVVMAVADQGPGIPLAEQPLVFDRYRQGPRTRGGAGLGLAIVKGLVVAHHGTVSLISSPGHGTRFEIALPRGGEPPVAVAASA